VRVHQSNPDDRGDHTITPFSRRLGRGQALVEFALVLPLMLLLLLLAVDFGRLFTTYIAVNNAAREGAFYAAEHAADDPFDGPTYIAEVDAIAREEVNAQGQGGEGALSVTPPVCFPAGGGAPIACNVAATQTSGIGNHVQVEVSQPFSLLTPFVGELFGGQLILTAQATAPVLDADVVTVLPPSPTPSLSPTPTPTASPTPTPSATPTLPPGATPTPSPTPVPPPTCFVPDRFNQFYFGSPGALDTWQTSAGFTGPLVDATDGKKIKSQTLTAGDEVLCSSTMTVDDKN
jgi:Flp pilus assembly protein TadG